MRLRTGCQAGGKQEGMGLPGWHAEGEQERGSLPSRVGFTCIVQGLSCAPLPDYPRHAKEQELCCVQSVRWSIQNLIFQISLLSEEQPSSPRSHVCGNLSCLERGPEQVKPPDGLGAPSQPLTSQGASTGSQAPAEPRISSTGPSLSWHALGVWVGFHIPGP